MSFLPLDQRHDCRVCGVWQCANCGWSRRPANRLRPDLQFCAHCQCVSGDFLPTRHAHPGIQRDHDEDANRLDQLALSL